MAGYKSQRHKRLADLLQQHQKVTGALGSVGREHVVVGTTRADISLNDGIMKILQFCVYIGGNLSLMT
jgi:hypothetical protein